MDFTGNTLMLIGYQPNAGNIGSQAAANNTIELVIDNYINQDFDIYNIITRQPTSRGTPNNDWMYREPVIYTIEGLMSASTLSSILDFNINSFLGANNYLSTKFNQLIQSALGQYIFTVYTGLNTFPAMGVLHVHISREREMYNCLKVTLDMQELLIPTTSPYYNTKNNSDRPPANQGVKNG